MASHKLELEEELASRKLGLVVVMASCKLEPMEESASQKLE